MRRREINVSVFRKAMHKEQYLHYSSGHPAEHKNSVIFTLMHRAKELSTREEDKRKEVRNIKQDLNRCGSPNWVIKKGENKVKEKSNRDARTTRTETKQKKGLAVIPYVKGLGEKIRRILKAADIITAFKPHATLRNMLVSLKNPIPKPKKTGVVYHIKCQECRADYVGETGR